MRRALLMSVAALAPALSPVRIVAQVPTAAELLERHEREMGGREAWDRHRSLRMSGVVEIPQRGLKGTIEVLRMKPNVFVQRIRLEGVGEVAQGFDGRTAWEVQPSGPALLTGPDAADMRTRADWLSEFAAPLALFGGRVDTAEFNGEPAWRATFASDIGIEVHTYFSRETGLRLAEVRQHPIGETASMYSGYRSVADIKLATRIVTRSPEGDEMIVTFDAIELDRVDSAAVAVPEAVRKLIGGAGS